MTLTLDEAIKYNKELQQGIDVHEMPKHYAAIQLGIEALKHYQGDKKIGCIRSDYFLPGETEGEK